MHRLYDIGGGLSCPLAPAHDDTDGKKAPSAQFIIGLNILWILISNPSANWVKKFSCAGSKVS